MLSTELGGYFQHLLDPVDRMYHKQTVRIYLMHLAASGESRTRTASYFDEEESDFVLEEEIKPWSQEAMNFSP